MVRRSHIEAIINILTVALKGVSKTRIMYRANLNFLHFDRYFSELLRAELVEIPDNPSGEFGRIVYKTTEKGRELLETLRKANEFSSL